MMVFSLKLNQPGWLNVFWGAILARIENLPAAGGTQPGRKPASGAQTPPEGDPADFESLRRFDPQAVSAVHQKFFAEVFRYIRYRVNDPQTAEDLAGEVFVRLLEALKTGRGPHTHLRGWLMGTASNLVNDYYRQAYTRPVAELDENLAAPGEAASHRLEEAEQEQAVRLAVSKLTVEQQDVLALRFGSGHSLEETARVLGKNVNAVKQLQFRALASLRRNLPEEWL